MSDWKPRLHPAIDYASLRIDAEAGFVLSRLDGATPAAQLPVMTGLPPQRIAEILQLLVEQGAILPAAEPPPAAADADDEDTDPGVDPAVLDRDPADPDPDPDSEPGAEPAADAVPRGDYRKLYESELHPLPADERVALAGCETGDRLLALCLDPLPEVLHALLDNAAAGLDHARLVAFHHRTATGLELLFKRAPLLRDGEVRRLLLRNPQLTEGMLRRLLQSQPLLAIHRVVISREASEHTRRRAGMILRSRFASATPEQRVELVLKSEGRVLGSLVGLALDGRSAALLCGRTYTSILLVQNLARWPGTPAPLVKHLLKQPVLRQQPGLKIMLERHPNAPRNRT